MNSKIKYCSSYDCEKHQLLMISESQSYKSIPLRTSRDLLLLIAGTTIQVFLKSLDLENDLGIEPNLPSYFWRERHTSHSWHRTAVRTPAPWRSWSPQSCRYPRTCYSSLKYTTHHAFNPIFIQKYIFALFSSL